MYLARTETEKIICIDLTLKNDYSYIPKAQRYTNKDWILAYEYYQIGKSNEYDKRYVTDPCTKAIFQIEKTKNDGKMYI